MNEIKEIESLDKRQNALNWMRYLILGLTCCTIFSCAINLIALCAISCITGCMSVLLFSFFRGLWMTAHNELIDEIEWGANRGIKLSVEFRQALRGFLKATDLPFTRSNGEFCYMVAFSTVFLISLK